MNTDNSSQPAQDSAELLVPLWQACCWGQKVQIWACLVQNIPVNDFNGWWRAAVWASAAVKLWMTGRILKLHTRLPLQTNIFSVVERSTAQHSSARLCTAYMAPRPVSHCPVWLNADGKYYLHLKACCFVPQLSGNKMKVLVVLLNALNIWLMSLWWVLAINS